MCEVYASGPQALGSVGADGNNLRGTSWPISSPVVATFDLSTMTFLSKAATHLFVDSWHCVNLIFHPAKRRGAHLLDPRSLGFIKLHMQLKLISACPPAHQIQIHHTSAALFDSFTHRFSCLRTLTDEGYCSAHQAVETMRGPDANRVGRQPKP